MMVMIPTMMVAVTNKKCRGLGAPPSLLCFLLLLLLVRADNGTYRNATAEKTASVNKPGGSVKHDHTKPLPVYLEIGGLDRHWNEAGISWRIEYVVLPEGEVDGGLEEAAPDSAGHDAGEEEDAHAGHGAARIRRRGLQQQPYSGAAAGGFPRVDGGGSNDDRDRSTVHEKLLQQQNLGGKTLEYFKAVESNEKLKRNAGDFRSTAEDVGPRRRNEADFAEKTALKLEKIKAMESVVAGDTRRSGTREKLLAKEQSLQTPAAPLLEGMAKDIRNGKHDGHGTTEALDWMEGGSDKAQVEAWKKAWKLEHLEPVMKRNDQARRAALEHFVSDTADESRSTGSTRDRQQVRRGTKALWSPVAEPSSTIKETFEKMRARHVVNPERQLLSSPLRASAFPASDSTKHQMLDQDGRHVMVKFILAPNQKYRLILESAEDPNRHLETATTRNSPPVVGFFDSSTTAFVSLAVGDRVSPLLHVENLDLLSRGMSHTFEFSVTSRQLQKNDPRYLGQTVKDTKAPTHAPRPTDAPQASTPPGGIPVTLAPTRFGGTRPPSLGGPTIPPTISAAPSFSPTVEPLCVSQTNGPVSFDGLYWAIRLARNNTNGDWEQLLGPVLSDLAETYTAIATCGQKGAFRSMTRIDLIEIHEGGTTSSEVEVIVQLFGSCEGCNTVPVELFRRTQESVSNLGENRRELANPCICPGPSRQAFMKAFNLKNQTNQAIALGDLLDVVDVHRVANCTPGVADDLVQQHTASVSVFLTRDPEQAGAAVSTGEQDAIIANFEDSFHEAGSLAEGTCDLARRNILSVLLDDTNARQRNRRLPDMSQTTDDVELHLLVTFECFGCDGQLFGKVDVQNSTNCLCPVETRQQGVRDRGLTVPLSEALKGAVLDSGETPDIGVSQVVPDLGLATTAQVADVMQVKEVDCGSSFSVFSAVVVVEYDLIPNITDVSEADVALLETQFVKGYNGLARRFCDPYFRRLSSAQAIVSQISNDGTIASFEFLVVGTCRGDCNETIPVYDPEAFRRKPNRERQLAWKQHRALRSLQELDPTCYCSATSSVDVGPSEPDVVQNYQALVNRFELETISEVSDCRFLTSFRSAVVLSVSGSVETPDQLTQLGQTFVDSYNQAISEGLCDSLFRQLTDFEISPNVTIAQGSPVNSTGQGNRELWDRILMAPERRAQMFTLAPTDAPTIASTGDLNLTLPVSDSAENLVLLQVSGTCRGCSSDSGLFDQTSGRRRNLQEDGADNTTLLKARVDSCFCPPNSTRVEPTQAQVLLALSSLPFIDKATLEQVRIVECPFKATDFSTTIVIDAYVSGDVTSNDEDLIGSSFISEYIQLSAEYCDTLFRQPETVLSIEHETLAETDGNGFPRVRFFLKLGGNCRGCRPNGDLFDDRRNRRLDHLVPNPDRRRTQTSSDRCFCPVDAPDRAIREDEFQDGYADVFANRRRLGGGQLQFDNAIILAWVGQLTRAPSVAVLDASILNFLKYPNCKVPAGTEHFIGDGYCDRDTIPNTDPPQYIYNVLNCGWDDGDCCESECQAGLTYVCGELGYACHLDGFVATTTVTDIVLEISQCQDFLLNQGQNLALLDSVGDGICNNEVNVLACAYDNKDCCESTCTTPLGETCASTQYFNCIDPTAPTVATPGVSPGACASKAVCTANPFCQPSDYCGDGWCDTFLNNAACGYDGGDCCFDTCADPPSLSWECGVVGYECVDPCSLDSSTAIAGAECTADPLYWIGDGYCDWYSPFNTPECNYDGGDCCESTCVSTQYTCGLSGYNCLNIDAISNVNNDNALCESLGGYLPFKGDGWCDYNNNIEACGYDDGDCCESTCVSGPEPCGIAGYLCLDPSAATDYSSSCDGVLSWIGDGWCDDSENNNPGCAYDGGDCCPVTCVSTFYQCGYYAPFNCIDPNGNLNSQYCSSSGGIPANVNNSVCDSQNNIPECNYDGGDCDVNSFNEQDCQNKGGYIYWIGDGWCDDGTNNIPECGYDGGDCCQSTCNSQTTTFQCDPNYSCGGCWDFNCQDPCAVGTKTTVQCPTPAAVPGAAAAFFFDTPPPSSKPSESSMPSPVPALSDAPSAEPSTKQPLLSDEPSPKPSTELPSSYLSEFPSSYPTAAPTPTSTP